jgi:hypothetical protein
MPSRYATSNQKATYRNSVEEEVLRFMNEEIGSHYFNPDHGLNLNVTVGEAELMLSSKVAFKELSDSGEL